MYQEQARELGGLRAGNAALSEELRELRKEDQELRAGKKLTAHRLRDDSTWEMSTSTDMAKSRTLKQAKRSLVGVLRE